MEMENEFGVACVDGDINTINKIMKTGYNDYDYGLRCACSGGQYEVAMLMLEKGANIGGSVPHLAGEGGNRKLIDFFIARGYNKFNNYLNGAASDQNVSLMLDMIKLGADDLKTAVYYWNLKEYRKTHQTP